jgi:hypothetical protein
MKKSVKYFSGSIALFIVVLFYRCSDEAAFFVYNDKSGISIKTGESGLFITNNTQGAIHYFVIEKTAATYTDWIPVCNSGNEVGVNLVKEVPYSELYGYYNNCEAVFYWWNCLQTENGEPKSAFLQSISFRTH